MPTSFSLAIMTWLTLAPSLQAAAGVPETAPEANRPQSAQPAPADAAAAQKSVRALINAIRYNKDAVAAKHLNFDGMAKLLLADSYAAATSAQRQDFVSALGTLVTRTSFPKGRDLFGYLDALLFETATAQGDTLHVKSVVVVHRNLKKVELPIEWVLTRSGSGWQVVDIISMNESTAHGIREEEVLPLMQEGGLAKVLQAMHERTNALPQPESGKAAAP